MMLESAIFTALREHPTIVRLIGVRINPNGQLKQDQSFPCMTQEVIGNNPPATMSGKCPTDNPIVEIVAWSTTKTEADEIIAAVNQHMQGYKNRALGIVGSTRSDQRSQPLPDTPNVYSESASFSIWHQRG